MSSERRSAPRPSDADSSFASVLRSPAALTRECLAGIVTSLALIPEVISFSVVAGVDPKASLVASIVLGPAMSLLGGRPAMVTAAAGSVALVIGPMVRAHGTAYVLPAVVLAGIVQVAFGTLGLARLMRFIPRSVMIGFVNALGILIFAAQVPHVLGQTPVVLGLFVLTVLIVQGFPRVSTAVPSALAAIVAATGIATACGWPVPNVGNGGPMDASLPGITPWLAPLNLETLRIVWPTALSVAFVGLLESLLTAKLVDDLTDTRSHKGRESWALGIANVLAGFYGGIAGCAMIGQTVVNVKIGGARTRVSTAVAAIVLLLLVTLLSNIMAQIPMVALAAVMMIVALKTVDWRSVAPATLQRMPLPETGVMVATVALTVWTGNLAIGVIGGAILAMVLFARRVAHVVQAPRTLSADGLSVTYAVHGPLFFGSSNDLVERFAYGQDPSQVVIDFTHAQIWDASTVATLDAIQTKYLDRGATVRFVGLDERSLAFHGRLTGSLG